MRVRFSLQMALATSVFSFAGGHGGLRAQPNQQEPIAAVTPDSPFLGVLQDHTLLRGVEDVHLHEDFAYIPCREGERLTICDVSEPRSPRIVSSFTHRELAQATGLAMHGDWLFVTSFSPQDRSFAPRLLVLDARDKTAIRHVSSLKIGDVGAIYKVRYRDGLCYVAHQADKRLYVVDVRDPEHPAVLSSVAVTSENDGPFSVLLQGPMALVGTIWGRSNRLAVVDIREPRQPAVLQTLTAPDFCTLTGDIVGGCYVTAGYSKNALVVFDVSNPDRVEVRGRLQDPRLAAPNRCVVVGSRAYLPMIKGDGIAVVDISDMAHPQFVTAFSHPIFKKTYGIAARGDLLHVGSREGDSLVVLNRHDLER